MRNDAGRVARSLIAVVLVGALPTIARAQTADTSNASSELTDELLRPGYQQRTWRSGSTVIATEVAAELRYDSNVFAISRRPIDDVILIVTPRVLLDGLYDNLKVHGEAFADVREYAANGTENHANYGGTASGNFTINSRNDVTASTRLERFAESRNDPEANLNRTLSPREIDAFAGNLKYEWTGNHVGFVFGGEIRHLDYLQAEDADRSLTTIQGSVRAAVNLSSHIALFVRPYVNRRDFDALVDRGGINRDATTFGGIGGVRLSISERWKGEIGIGAFSSNPDDASLRSFSGFAANVDLTWSPRRRTVVILRAFSGDGSTVRTGALGRTDASFSLHLDQEVRHNLLFSATVGYQNTAYRGLGNRLRTASVGVQSEYLFNRLVGVFIDASYARRRAFPSTDSFNRAYVGIGVRFRH